MPLPFSRPAVIRLRRCRGGSQIRPPPVDHDVRRVRRLGAPPHRVSPFGRVPFSAAKKEPKRRRGWAPMGVPAHSRATPRPLGVADFISLASPGRAKLAHSIAPPLQRKPASLGFALGAACGGLKALLPSAKFPARKIRLRVLIPSGPLGPGSVQNSGLFHFTAAPGSDQPWQGVRDRRRAGRCRFHEPGTGESGTRPYGGPGKYTPAENRRAGLGPAPTISQAKHSKTGGRVGRCPAPTE